MDFIDSKNMDSELKRYYQNKKLIKMKQEYIEKLEARLMSIKRAYAYIDSSFELKDNLQSVLYDKEVVDGGSIPCSDVDRQIDNITLGLDREVNIINNKIICAEVEICKVENANDLVDEVLKSINEDDHKIIELRYNKKYSVLKISLECHMSTSSVNKSIKNIKDKIYTKQI